MNFAFCQVGYNRICPLNTLIRSNIRTKALSVTRAHKSFTNMTE